MSATAALNSSINRRRIHHLHHLRRHFALSRIRCSVSNPRGFGPADDNVKKRVGLSKEQKDLLSRQRKSVNRQSGTLPGRNISTIQDEKAVSTKLSNEESSTLEARLQQYEAILGSSPKDLVALQGAAVTYAELGRYANAASLLEDLTKDKPNDPDVFRLLGEVRYELKEYEASAAAYKICTKMLGNTDFEILRGLTNALFAAKKPDEAVQVLVEARKRLNIQQVNDASMGTGGGIEEERSQVDPVQGIILKENGNFGDAERMFIQARFFAPEKAKALVDHYSRR